jgi:hypothetical protein
MISPQLRGVPNVAGRAQRMAGQGERPALFESTALFIATGQDAANATVLCGELSLGSAIVAEEWVEAHDILGRNR